MLRDDTVRLRHMFGAAQDIVRFAAGRSRADLDSDQMLFFALLHGLQIVGEAASQVSPERRAAIPAIPWRTIVGMRHRLVRAYADVNRSIIWDTVNSDISPLIAILERALVIADATSTPERNA